MKKEAFLKFLCNDLVERFWDAGHALGQVVFYLLAVASIVMDVLFPESGWLRPALAIFVGLGLHAYIVVSIDKYTSINRSRKEKAIRKKLNDDILPKLQEVKDALVKGVYPKDQVNCFITSLLEFLFLDPGKTYIQKVLNGVSELSPKKLQASGNAYFDLRIGEDCLYINYAPAAIDGLKKDPAILNVKTY